MVLGDIGEHRRPYLGWGKSHWCDPVIHGTPFPLLTCTAVLYKGHEGHIAHVGAKLGCCEGDGDGEW